MISLDEVLARVMALEQQMSGLVYALTHPVNQDGTAETISPFSAEHVMKVFGTEEESKTERNSNERI